MFSAIIAAIQSFPAVLKLVQGFVDEFQLWQLSRIDDYYSKKDVQRKAILSIIRKASGVTDEERSACIKLLYELNHSP